MKTLLTTIALLWTTQSFAQDDPRSILHQLQCNDKQIIEQSLLEKYNERPIAKGKVALRIQSGEVFKLDMIFYASNEDKSYTLVGYSDDGYGCIIATGTEFDVYRDGPDI